MDHPIRTAFCHLLFLENGGKLNSKGKPIDIGKRRSLCNRPYDCSTCDVMQRSLRQIPPGTSATWECVDCLEKTKSQPRALPGYFTSGECPRCGYETSFLQLVLRSGG